MDEVIVFSLFGASNVGKYTYLNFFLEDVGRTKDVINKPIKWVFPIPFDNEDNMLVVSIYENAMRPSTIAAIVMFDVTDAFSYRESINTIKQLVAHYPQLYIVWLANKIDSNNRQVTKREAIKVKRYLGRGDLLHYREVSAKKGNNMLESLELLLNITCSFTLTEVSEGIANMSLD